MILRRNPVIQSPTCAPAWHIAQWFNTDSPMTLDTLRGKVLVLTAFQMLCPGCVSHSLPQAARVAALFPREQVQVIGLHTVFEHHEAMTATALRAFLHEYRIAFPVAVDQPGDNDPIPKTMRSYGMRGTPSLILIDGQGRLRQHLFGRIEDMELGARIAALAAETTAMPASQSQIPARSAEPMQACTDQHCTVDPGDIGR